MFSVITQQLQFWGVECVLDLLPDARSVVLFHLTFLSNSLCVPEWDIGFSSQPCIWIATFLLLESLPFLPRLCHSSQIPVSWRLLILASRNPTIRLKVFNIVSSK